MWKINQINWIPSIGDPTFLGWFTVFCYIVTSMLAAKVYFNAQNLFSSNTLRKQQIFWLFIVVVMLFLGINKQLDLQSLLTAVGRYYAKKEGWYEERHRIQIAFIAGFVVMSLFTFAMLIRYMTNSLKENLLAILGFVFLVTFIIIRASSFHHVDAFLMERIIGVRVNWILELAGIFLISYSALSVLKGKAPV